MDAILSLLTASSSGAQLRPDEIWSGLVGFLVISAVVIAGYVVLFRRCVPRAPATTPEFLREPPTDMPPAVVGLLFNSGPSPEKLAATLLDLVRRGIIEMQPVRRPSLAPDDSGRDDRLLCLRRDRLGELRPFEAVFVYELFDHISGRSDRVLLSTLRSWWATHPATAQVVAGFWTVPLRREAEESGLIRTAGFSGKTVLSWYAVIPFVFIVAAWPLINVWAFLMFSLGCVMLYGAQAATNLTPSGAELAARYGAFKRFLEQFGRMQDKPAEAVILWEQYLTLAIVLGLATESMDDLYIEPPTFGDYGSAGRAGRRLPPSIREGRFADADEALQYAAFRRWYDPTLPAVTMGSSDGVPWLGFKPAIDTGSAEATVFMGRVVHYRVVTGFNGLRGLIYNARWCIIVPAAIVAVCVTIVLATQ